MPLERRPLILVVEDEPELARVLVDYLAKAELDAAVLHNGLEVVPFVRERRILRLPPVLMFGALPSAQRFSRLLTDALSVAPANG